jgi:hypothetical protein
MLKDLRKEINKQFKIYMSGKFGYSSTEIKDKQGSPQACTGKTSL